MFTFIAGILRPLLIFGKPGKGTASPDSFLTFMVERDVLLLPNDLLFHQIAISAPIFHSWGQFSEERQFRRSFFHAFSFLRRVRVWVWGQWAITPFNASFRTRIFVRRKEIEWVYGSAAGSWFIFRIQRAMSLFRSFWGLANKHFEHNAGGTKLHCKKCVSRESYTKEKVVCYSVHRAFDNDPIAFLGRHTVRFG